MCHPHVSDVPRIALDMLPKFVTRFTYNQPPTLFFIVLIGTLITPCMLASNNHQSIWWNPCNYTPNKPGRTTRSINKLTLTVNRYVREFNVTTRKRIEEIYGPKNYSITPKKFKNMTMESYYKEFVELGMKYEEAIKLRLDTQDNNFSHINRNELMEKGKHVIKAILCEIFDTIRPKNKKRNKINKIKTKQDNIVIPQTSNLTDLIRIDEHINTTYECLLRSLKNYLKKNSKLRHVKSRKQKKAGNKKRKTKKHRRPKL